MAKRRITETKRKKSRPERKGHLWLAKIYEWRRTGLLINTTMIDPTTKVSVGSTYTHPRIMRTVRVELSTGA